MGDRPMGDSPVDDSPAQSAPRAAPAPHQPPPAQPAPTARPDPYSQFGNPLNDTWGARQTAEPVGIARPDHAHTARRRRPWLTRAVIVVVVVMLAGSAWLGRTWLDERWDSLYEQVEEWTGNETGDATGPVSDQQSAPEIEQIDLSGVEPVEYQDNAENRAFLQWEREQRAELDSRGRDLLVAFDVRVDESQGPTRAADTMAAAASRVRAMLELVDTAPDSQLRTAAVTTFMQMLHTFDLFERTIREGSPQLASEAEQAMTDLGSTLAKYEGFAEQSYLFGA